MNALCASIFLGNCSSHPLSLAHSHHLFKNLFKNLFVAASISLHCLSIPPFLLRVSACRSMAKCAICLTILGQFVVIFHLIPVVLSRCGFLITRSTTSGNSRPDMFQLCFTPNLILSCPLHRLQCTQSRCRVPSPCWSSCMIYHSLA